ncbi:MAG: glutamate--tRNA ligase, partial [Campylobacteraceae bacterium]|nr:glutamate--tRNA ligase [Campylobacteraceae bacterium]MDY4121124.1 glutamate--tRNA ligase [Campylobacter sp.]
VKWQTLYYQSKNLKFHQEFAHKLLSEGKAFLCFCDEETLALKKQKAKAENKPYRYDGACENLSSEEVFNNPRPAVVRLKIPKDADFSFVDGIKGPVEFEPSNFDSFVLLRADKTPTYNFACAIDDMLEGVTCVIRGEDHVSNTPRQNLIRLALGYTDQIKYAHLPIILNKTGQKMSKRENSSSVKWLLETGYSPEAIANYLLLLGNKTPCEIFSLDEAKEWFSLDKLSKSPAKFDEDKLAQINREHIKRASDERLKELGIPKPALARFYTQESSLIPEIKEKISAIYSKKEIPDEWRENAGILKKAILEFQTFPETFKEFQSQLIAKTALKGKGFFMPLRLLLTGAQHGPELSELYALIKDDLREIVSL